MATQVAVIGAGLAGVAAARTLTGAGVAVRLYEQSAGWGGRLATRTWGGERFDVGAGFVVARAPEFRQALEPLLASGALVPWADRLARWDGIRRTMDPLTAGVRRLVAPEGFASAVERLADGLELHAGRQVAALAVERARWKLTLRRIPEGALDTVHADALVVAIPGPEALALASTAGEGIEPFVVQELARVAFDPALVVLASYAGPAPTWRGLAAEDGPVRWIGIESSKRPAVRTTVAIHAAPALSAELFGATEPEVRSVVLAAAAQLGGEWLLDPLETRVVRWRHARPTILASARALLSEGPAPAAFCGDWCHGPTAEAAWLSGIAAAERLLLARLV